MPIKNYTTSVPANRNIEEIQTALDKDFEGQAVNIRVKDGEAGFKGRDLTARSGYVDGRKVVLDHIEESDSLSLRIGEKIGRPSTYVNESYLYDAYRLIHWVIPRVGIRIIRINRHFEINHFILNLLRNNPERPSVFVFTFNPILLKLMFQVYF